MLIIAAIINFIAMLLHLGCIVFGAQWYSALGAGEKMLNLVKNKSWKPYIITSIISIILLVWMLYALSGANIIPSLPLSRTVLWLISIIYILRGIVGLSSPKFRAHFLGNSTTFWNVSSSICLFSGLIHAIGVYQLTFNNI